MEEHKLLKPLLFRGVVWALSSFKIADTTFIVAGFGSWLYIFQETEEGVWSNAARL